MSTLVLRLDPETGTYGPAVDQVLDDSNSELSQVSVGGAVRQVSGFEILNVPIGTAIVGAAGAGLADAAIHFIAPLIPIPAGVLTPSQKRAALLFGAAALVHWKPIKGFLSSAGADATAFVLTLDALVTVFNARSLVGQFLEKVAPKGFSHLTNGRTLAQEQGRQDALNGGGDDESFVNSASLVPARGVHLGV